MVDNGRPVERKSTLSSNVFLCLKCPIGVPSRRDTCLNSHKEESRDDQERVAYMNYHDIKTSEFKRDLCIFSGFGRSVDGLVEAYSKDFRRIINYYAPSFSRTITS